MKAAFAGTTEMAFGNVVGSNTCNVLLILGLAALAAPLEIAPAVLKRDLPVLLALSILTALLASDGRLGAVDGLVLLAEASRTPSSPSARSGAGRTRRPPRRPFPPGATAGSSTGSRSWRASRSSSPAPTSSSARR